MIKDNINEDTMVPDHDANSGQGSVVPSPVETGETARPQDNMAETDAGVAVVQGQPVPRSAVLLALVSALQGMDQAELDRVANLLDASQDVNIDPANSVPDLQGVNLASITAKQSVNEIFAGEVELTEEFKDKAALVFEASVNAQVAVLEAKMQEAQEAQVSEAVEHVTKTIVEDLDRYLTFTAESFVEDNAPILEQTIRGVASERFMEGVIALAESFNIDLPQAKVDVVEELTAKVESLEAQLNEAVDARINESNARKALEQEKIFEDVSKGLTALQKDRLRQLSENVTIDGDVDSYRTGLVTLKESVTAVVATPAQKPAVVQIDEENGVLLESANQPAPSKNEQRLMDLLGRMG